MFPKISLRGLGMRPAHRAPAVLLGLILAGVLPANLASGQEGAPGAPPDLPAPLEEAPQPQPTPEFEPGEPEASQDPELQPPAPPPPPVTPPQVAPPPVPATPSRPGQAAPSLQADRLAKGERSTLNLKDTDLTALISLVSELTGRNFIVDPRVKGKVTVISSKPLSAAEVYQVFLSVLNVHGFAVVPGKAASKIVPIVNAKQDAVPTVTEKSPGRGDEYITRVIQVQNVSVAQLVPILRPLLSQQAHLAAYPASNVLIASGEAANVDRLVQIIERIDIAGDESVEVVPMSHASAAEVVRILQSLQKATEKDQLPVGQPTLVADERTNSVIIGGGPAQRARLRELIKQLDTPLESGGNTEVVYLKYAKAKELATVLTGMGPALSAGKDAKPAAAGAAQAAGKDGLMIQPDEATNALVISAAPDVMRSIKSVIRQLDVRRAQVLVEAVIAEVSSNKTREFGVQWAYFDPASQTPVGIINFGGSGVGIGNLALGAASGTLSSLPDGALLGAGDIKDGTGFAGFVRALSGDGDTNILSTPTLLTMDNEEAEIVVGQNVPFVTGSYASTGGGTTPANPFQTIQRQDVGLTLKVRPQINEGSAVKLEISQEVSSIGAGAAGAADIITNKRALKTTVLVDNGQVVVLGGLIDDDLQESEQRVPILGDIPVLGWLFSYKRTTKVKRNLMVFLHPVILRDDTQNAVVTNDKYTYMRARQLDVRNRGVNLMSDKESPLMPELDRLLTLPPPFREAVPAEGGGVELPPPPPVPGTGAR